MEFKELYDMVEYEVSRCIAEGIIAAPAYIPLYGGQSVVENITYEIIARLFVLSFGHFGEKSIWANNLHNIIYGRYKDNTSFEANLKTVRRDETQKRVIHQNQIDDLRKLGINIPEHHTMISNKKGRIYSAPELYFIMESIEGGYSSFFKLLTSNRLTDPKKISYYDFARSYEGLNSKYSKARNCSNKIEYIIRWVDIVKLETKFKVSIINALAEYMCTNDNVTLDDACVGYWGFTGYSKNNSRGSEYGITLPLEAYQILRYGKYIDYYKENCYLQKSLDVYNERMEFSEIIRRIKYDAMTFFKPFHEEDKKTINTMYVFCHDKYPVVEMHNPFVFKNEDGTINRRKIKYARQIINYLLKPDELAKLRNKD